MKWHDLLSDGFGRIPEVMERTLSGLSQDEVDWQPSSDTNSIGWLCWHLTRSQDVQVAELMNEEEVWVEGKWYEKFNLPANPGDFGFGYTPEQVSAFVAPGAGIMLDYLRATTAKSLQYFQALSEEDLDRELDEPQWQPLPTVGVRLISILADNLQHAGQASYIRGLKQGKGWQKF